MSVTVPPYVASPDDIRCAQSVVLMILKYFIPEKNWGFVDADGLCSFIKDKWSWSEAPATSLAEMGFEIKCYTDFDVRIFMQSPNTFFFDKYGQEQGQIMMDHIDLPSAIDICQRYLANSHIETLLRGWTVNDLQQLLKDGFLIMAWVNPSVLHSTLECGAGHFVCVYRYDSETRCVSFHDPGSTINGEPVNQWQGARIGFDHFMRAARADGEDGSGLTAFRLKKFSSSRT